MTTELWFRDPFAYLKQCAELMVTNTIWDGSILDAKTYDAQKIMELHYPSSFDYRILIVRSEGTVELRRGDSVDTPTAVYPTWEYDVGTLTDLESLLDNPVGDSLEACKDPKTPSAFRPIFGQEHRVVISRWPDAGTPRGRAFLRALTGLQEDYPEAIIHLWGPHSYRAAFGMKFRAADMDSSMPIGEFVVLGNGKRTSLQQLPKFAQWVSMLGFTQGDLKKKEKRYLFNMKSALWASEFFETNLKFKAQGQDPIDPNTHHHLPATTVSTMATKLRASDGDKIVCDSCSLFRTCKYYREEAVCSMPGSDGAGLAGYFGTRSSDHIIDGLGKVLAVQAERFQRAVEDEEYADEIDPNVTRLGSVVLNDGVKLAKLVNPALAAAGAPKVGVFVGGQHVHAATPNTLVADVVKELEARGTPRDAITGEMVNAEIMARQGKQMIEVTSRD